MSALKHLLEASKREKIPREKEASPDPNDVCGHLKMKTNIQWFSQKDLQDYKDTKGKVMADGVHPDIPKEELYTSLLTSIKEYKEQEDFELIESTMRAITIAPAASKSANKKKRRKRHKNKQKKKHAMKKKN